AFDSRDALLKASANRYDAIFLDVRMPALDGVELGRVLRRFERSPQLVFVSAYDTAAVDAFELAAVDYLRKPVSRRRLEEALGRVSVAADNGDRAEARVTATTPAPVDAGPGDGEPNGMEGADVIAVGTARGGTRLIPRESVL